MTIGKMYQAGVLALACIAMGCGGVPKDETRVTSDKAGGPNHPGGLRDAGGSRDAGALRDAGEIKTADGWACGFNQCGPGRRSGSGSAEDLQSAQALCAISVNGTDCCGGVVQDSFNCIPNSGCDAYCHCPMPTVVPCTCENTPCYSLTCPGCCDNT
jgi:hypothetical protein